MNPEEARATVRSLAPEKLVFIARTLGNRTPDELEEFREALRKVWTEFGPAEDMDPFFDALMELMRYQPEIPKAGAA